MVANFLAGGAAINVLAQQMDAEVIVVDVGVRATIPEPPRSTTDVRARLIRARVRNGTRDLSIGPALTRPESLAAIDVGIRLADELRRSDVAIAAVGEMGMATRPQRARSSPRSPVATPGRSRAAAPGSTMRRMRARWTPSRAACGASDGRRPTRCSSSTRSAAWRWQRSRASSSPQQPLASRSSSTASSRPRRRSSLHASAPRCLRGSSPRTGLRSRATRSRSRHSGSTLCSISACDWARIRSHARARAHRCGLRIA